MELHILGTRGIPARHGGFETFAEQLSLHMVSQGHIVTVYCQLGPNETEFKDTWRGIHRIGLSVGNGPSGTILFDLRSALLCDHDRNVTVLTLGYNTAVFSIFHRLRGIRHVMNMDGIEWKRKKWSTSQKLWLRLNERLGARLANLLVADHPEIKAHLAHNVSSAKITVIPYGDDEIRQVDSNILSRFGLSALKYCLIVARPEPENSILEIVEAFAQEPRPFRLVVLGHYVPEHNKYHSIIMKMAEDRNISFLGPIYDPETVKALRFHAMIYLHGHQVGGTNPSLVEALAAGNAVIAHDNKFNRWVAGPSARYFSSVKGLADVFSDLENDPSKLDAMRLGSKDQHYKYFRREKILQAYEQLLTGLPLEEHQWSSVTVEASVKPILEPGFILSRDPCPGYFSIGSVALLKQDTAAQLARQPCAKCGQLIAPRAYDGTWMPQMHWAVITSRNVKRREVADQVVARNTSLRLSD